MQSNVTVFVATYLVFLDALLAAGLIVVLFLRRPRTEWIRWAIAIGITVVIAYVLAQVGAALYNDPRPFSQDHVKPLISHAADNGFPSDHGLLAAAIVAAVILVDLRFAVVFVVFGVLVDWARVGAGIHHVTDVVGSAMFVALGLVVAWSVTPALVRWLLPHVPPRFLPEPQQAQPPRDTGYSGSVSAPGGDRNRKRRV